MSTGVFRTPTPERIGAYRLQREIGRGGMGVVYSAERSDGQLEHRVAIKVMREASHRPDVVARFERERQTLAKLDHPNIAKIFDGGRTVEGDPYLVMELVQGLPIDRHCQVFFLNLEQRLLLFQKVCSAVAHAHRNLIVHRDLKPSNILVTEEGVPKLLDFGIAKWLDEAGELTTLGQLVMTPAYASPEQIAGQPPQVTSDVYSLGVLLYELLTLTRPHSEEALSLSHLANAVLNITPTTASEALALGHRRGLTTSWRPTELRGDLDAILRQALRKDSAERYASVDALADDISRHLDGLPIAARKGSRVYQFGCFVQRNSWQAAAAALVVAILIAANVISGVQAKRRAAERDKVLLEQTKAVEVSEFMIELFKKIEPETGLGHGLTAEEMLDRGAEEIAATEYAQPLVEASLYRSVGVSYSRLGVFEKSIVALDHALMIARRNLPADHPEIVDLVTTLIAIEAEAHDLRQTDEFFYWAERVAILTNEHQLRELLLVERAAVAWSAGQRDAALDFWRQAGLLVRRAPAERILDHVTVKLSQRAGSRAEVELLMVFLSVVPTHEQMKVDVPAGPFVGAQESSPKLPLDFGTDHPIWRISRAAAMSGKNLDVGTAVQLARNRMQGYGSDSPALLEPLRRLAEAELNANDPQAALRALELAVSLPYPASWLAHQHTQAVVELARLEARLGRAERSRGLLAAALEARDLDVFDRAALQAEHGRVLIALGRDQEGGQALSEALVLLRSHRSGDAVEQIAALEADLARFAGSPTSPLSAQADELLP